MLDFLILVAGLGLLVGGGAMLVRGASDLAERWGVSATVVGLTVVGFGTSAPELVVNIIGASTGATALAFGNVAGSNITNLALVLGLAAVITPMTIESQLAKREIPLLLLTTTVLAVVGVDEAIDGLPDLITRSDALVLLLLFCVFLYVIVLDYFRAQRREDRLLAVVTEFPMLPYAHSPFVWLIVSVGLVLLYVGGQLTVDGAVGVAEDFDVSPTIIGLFVVAIGTSMPELVTTVIAAMRNEPDMALGNVIGSNLFNILVVLPVSALIRPMPVPDGGVADIGMSWFLAAVLIPVFLWRDARLGRIAGSLFILAYVAYMVLRLA